MTNLAPQGTKSLTAPLYEFSDGGYREVTLPAKFPFTQDIPALYEGNAVSQPIKIAKEGTYFKAVRDDAGKLKLHKIDITAKDLSQMVENARRDVPLNLEHYKGGPNYYGWVRSKTAQMSVQVDEDGKAALLAHLEVTPEVLQAVEKGHFRDFSPELDLHEKRLTGLALTNYPVMQEIHQFSEAFSAPGDGLQEESMTEAEKQAMLAELRESVQAEFSTQIAELSQKVEAEEKARKAAEREARIANLTLEFSTKVRELVGGKDGKAKLLPGAAEGLTQLYVFCAQHADTEFSLGEDTVNPVGLLEHVLSFVPAADVYTQVSKDTDSKADMSNLESDDDGLSDEDYQVLLSRTKDAFQELNHA